MSEKKTDTEAGPMSADRARQIILARRAKFVAAALAGIGAVGCDGSGPGPTVCLSVVETEDDAGKPDGTGKQSRDAGPRVCLSVAPVDPGRPPRFDGGPRVCLTAPRPEDAGRPDAGDAGKPVDAGGLDAGPKVCLSMVVLRSDGDDREVES